MSANILSTRPFYTDGHTVFVEKQAQLPSGEVISKGCIQHPGAVVIVPFTDDGQVLLIRQYRFGVEDYLLEVPAGTLEPGEAPRTAAERELQEETGYWAETFIPLDGFYALPGLSNEYMHLFIARDLHLTQQMLDADEIIEVVPMPLSEALIKINTNEIQDAKTIIGLLRAANH
jgi:ADP-ribose pyrophosphatase